MHYLLLLVVYFYLYMIFYFCPPALLGMAVQGFAPPVGQALVAVGILGLFLAGYRAKLAVDSYFAVGGGFVRAHMDSGEELRAQVGILLAVGKRFFSRRLC